MKSLKSALMSGTAGLALMFGSAQADLHPLPSPSAEPVSIEIVMQHYNTKASTDLASFETHMNADKPAGTPRILFLDPDVISAYRQTNLGMPYANAVADYIAARTGVKHTADELAQVAATSDDLTDGVAPPQILNPSLKGKKLEAESCYISPYNINMPARQYLSLRFLTVASQADEMYDTLAGRLFDNDMTREEASAYVNGVAAWKCLDTHFAPLISSPVPETALESLHKMEMFADVGAAMQMIKYGADVSVINKIIDYRATFVGLAGRVNANVLENDNPNAYAITNAWTMPALDALNDYIDKNGVERVRQMSLTEMKRLALLLTEQNALSRPQLATLIGEAKQGDKFFSLLKEQHVDEKDIEILKGFVRENRNLTESVIARTTRKMTTEEDTNSAQSLGTRTIFQLYASKMDDVLKNSATPNDIATRLEAKAGIMNDSRKLLDSAAPSLEFQTTDIVGTFYSIPPQLDVKTLIEEADKAQSPAGNGNRIFQTPRLKKPAETSF